MLSFILWLFTVGLAYASPFLVCDPIQAGADQFTKPASYILTGLGANPISTPATVNADGSVQLHYDLVNLQNGTYTVTAAAVSAVGGVSPASSPFLIHKRNPKHPY